MKKQKDNLTYSPKDRPEDTITISSEEKHSTNIKKVEDNFKLTDDPRLEDLEIMSTPLEMTHEEYEDRFNEYLDEYIEEQFDEYHDEYVDFWSNIDRIKRA